MDYSKTSNGIEYTEELYSSEGMAFMLFPAKEHTPEMVKQAIREIFNERDVVSMKVATDRDWESVTAPKSLPILLPKVCGGTKSTQTIIR